VAKGEISEESSAAGITPGDMIIGVTRLGVTCSPDDELCDVRTMTWDVLVARLRVMPVTVRFMRIEEGPPSAPSS
jgi:hypothetical protein